MHWQALFHSRPCLKWLFFQRLRIRSSPCRDSCACYSRCLSAKKPAFHECSTLVAECSLTVCLVTARGNSAHARKCARGAQGAFVVKRESNSECRAAAARTRTSLSRLEIPRVRMNAASGVASSRERILINRSFAAPSTGGADTRTSKRPSRTHPIPSGEARGLMRRRRMRSAP